MVKGGVLNAGRVKENKGNTFLGIMLVGVVVDNPRPSPLVLQTI